MPGYSITATNAGNVTHPAAPLGGPIYIALRVIGYAVPIAAVAVTIDALRRPVSAFGGSATARWWWAGPQIALLAALGGVWLASLAKVLGPSALDLAGGLVALYVFVAAALQVAYLLVVVFPRRREPAEG